MSELLELVKSRRSVRSFDGQALRPADREKLARYLENIPNPFGVPVRFVLLDAEEQGLSSPVITGEKLYVAGIVPKGPNAEPAFGFSFEKLVLFAWSLGIGTTWIGGTMKRENFERAAGLREGEMMPCVSPLGYPADKPSLREAMMRRAVGADARLSPEKLLFDGAWGVPLKPEREELREALEMLRRAPSAVNRQPWRIVAKDGAFHFYEKKDKGYVSEKTGDLQKVDLGIALCHFVTGLEAKGLRAELSLSDPGLSVPENADYVATVRADF